MYEPFNYTFMSMRRLRERGRLKVGEYPTTEDIERMNAAKVERMKEELKLHDDSTIKDLRDAVVALAKD